MFTCAEGTIGCILEVLRVWVRQAEKDTYVSTWQGFVYVASRHWARTNGAFNGSMIDTFANRIVACVICTQIPSV